MFEVAGRKGEMHQLCAAGHQRALGHNRGHFIMCYLPYGASKRALFTKGGLIVFVSLHHLQISAIPPSLYEAL